LLLRKSEGRTIDFEIRSADRRLKRGSSREDSEERIHPSYVAFQRYGPQYQYNQMAFSNPEGGGQPIVEVDGKIQFGLAGQADLEALDPEELSKTDVAVEVVGRFCGQARG
jgi:hypothetical protein